MQIQHLGRNEILVGDCLGYLNAMPDASVDVCFTSPPYNDVGFGKGSHAHYSEGGSESPKDWLPWMEGVLREMLRVSRKRVVLNVQPVWSNRENVYRLIGDSASDLKNIVIWNKPNPKPSSNPNSMSSKYEFLLVYKDARIESRFGWNLWDLPINNDTTYTKINNAVMSRSLCAKAIGEFTSPGDLVLDPFMGLGTTAVECLRQGRDYLGFEISPRYVELAKGRIEAERLGIRPSLGSAEPCLFD